VPDLNFLKWIRLKGLGMQTNHRILIVEDAPLDAELAKIEISRVLVSCEFLVVETQDDFMNSLQYFKPDIIVSDYSLPSFDGLTALKLALEHTPMTPFIIITGSINEDTAVECMKAGATDYVIKDNIKRLGLAVKHALEERQIKIERLKAQEALFQSELKFRTITEQLTDVVFITDLSRVITYVSPACNMVFGFTPNKMIGCFFDEFVASTDSDKARAVLSLEKAQEVSMKNFELLMKHKNGSVFCGELNCTRFVVNGIKGGTLGVIRDISQRKRNEEQITIALKEKEVLLRELYHRTKNNMQVILSMFALQSTNTKNKKVLDLFKKMENHIQAMSLIHQKLYQSQNLSMINLNEYIRDLAELLLQGYSDSAKSISVKFDMQDIFVLIDTAIPCGQILNELFSNIAKYAFPDGTGGIVSIHLSRSEQGIIELIVTDNGVGVTHHFNFRSRKTLGLQTIFAIGEHQLLGTVILTNHKGLSCRITFKDTFYSPRV
jgi:PAS domain S-box-containing protein